MRGKVDGTHIHDGGIGITPAYAGKRGFRWCFYVVCWDHPRVCGEKQHGRGGTLPVCGSPPRMRGKENVQGPELGATRITPAYAGKRLWSDTWCLTDWDHPRVCGEKTKKIT